MFLSRQALLQARPGVGVRRGQEGEDARVVRRGGQPGRPRPQVRVGLQLQLREDRPPGEPRRGQGIQVDRPPHPAGNIWISGEILILNTQLLKLLPKFTRSKLSV